MIEALVDLWEEPADAKCITTNGYVKKDGTLVMGAGVAGQAQKRYPALPWWWGRCVARDGNHVYPWVDEDGTRLLSFPVKHRWYEKADLDLIKRSAHELVEAANVLNLDKILLPLPGCGNGQLSWADVKPVLEPILDDRFWLINNKITKDFYPNEII